MYRHEESKTPGTRSAENREVAVEDQPSSEGGTGGDRSSTGAISVRTPGAARTERVHCDPITGGILSQLIDQVKGQLAEAEECVEWYERKKSEYRGQLDRLEHLQELMDSEFTD